MMVKWANDGILQANDSKMLINDGEMSEWAYTHFSIIGEHFTILTRFIHSSLRSCTDCMNYKTFILLCFWVMDSKGTGGSKSSSLVESIPSSVFSPKIVSSLSSLVWGLSSSISSLILARLLTYNEKEKKLIVVCSSKMSSKYS